MRSGNLRVIARIAVTTHSATGVSCTPPALQSVTPSGTRSTSQSTPALTVCRTSRCGAAARISSSRRGSAPREHAPSARPRPPRGSARRRSGSARPRAAARRAPRRRASRARGCAPRASYEVATCSPSGPARASRGRRRRRRAGAGAADVAVDVSGVAGCCSGRVRRGRLRRGRRVDDLELRLDLDLRGLRGPRRAVAVGERHGGRVGRRGRGRGRVGGLAGQRQRHEARRPGLGRGLRGRRRWASCPGRRRRSSRRP